MFRFYSDANLASKVRIAIVGTHSEGVLKVAVARCSNKDNFIKKKGRQIAEGRLNKNKIYNQYPMDNCEVKTFVEIAKGIAKEVEETKVIYKVQEEMRIIASVE